MPSCVALLSPSYLPDFPACAEPEARPGGGAGRGGAGAGDVAGLGGQVALPSPDGEVVYAGCRGALLALRRGDLALLDVHKVGRPGGPCRRAGAGACCVRGLGQGHSCVEGPGAGACLRGM